MCTGCAPELDKRGGDRKSAHRASSSTTVHGEHHSDDDGSFSETSSEEEADEMGPEPTTWKGISFQGKDEARYVVDEQHLPVELAIKADAISADMGFVNKKLFRSFFYSGVLCWLCSLTS